MPQVDDACPFCVTEQLKTVLMETEHFRAVADHAPLVTGHILVMPRTHFACYGTVPAEWDAELAAIRAKITAFLTAQYQAVVWMENGVFHQTVYHAHLHALPLGPVAPSVVEMPELAGRAVTSLADVRRWYAEHGPYTYLEEPDGQAAFFPADEMRYRRLLFALYTQTGQNEPWQAPAERLRTGAPRVNALMAAWHTAHPIPPTEEHFTQE